jgi:hypothetical protein
LGSGLSSIGASLCVKHNQDVTEVDLSNIAIETMTNLYEKIDRIKFFKKFLK